MTAIEAAPARPEAGAEESKEAAFPQRSRPNHPLTPPAHRLGNLPQQPLAPQQDTDAPKEKGGEKEKKEGKGEGKEGEGGGRGKKRRKKEE